MAKSNTHSTLSYRLLTWGLFPAALLYTGILAFKSKNSHYLAQRLGRYKKHIEAKQVIWCHCASVGEINTALPLLRKLIDRGESLLISTNTATGYQVLANTKLKNTQTIFFPLDYRTFAHKLIKEFSPKLYLLFETELWPNILLAIANHHIPIAIINGRISEKTLRAPSLVLKNYKIALFQASRIIASSQENATRFIALGANPDTITTLDNLKFANITTPSNPIDTCPIDFPFLLCASTHPGEEDTIIQQWKTSKPTHLGLVIAIRHPQRRKEVRKILETNQLPYQLHSNNPANISSDEIYIIDTLGQLMPFMKKAELVFMGGSLIPIGGHNVIEPALFGRCILTGPHHDDFKNIVDELKKCNGIIVVNDANQLVNEIHALLSNPERKAELGNNAKNYVMNKKHVLQNYQEIVFKLIDDQS